MHFWTEQLIQEYLENLGKELLNQAIETFKARKNQIPNELTRKRYHLYRLANQQRRDFASGELTYEPMGVLSTNKLVHLYTWILNNTQYQLWNEMLEHDEDFTSEELDTLGDETQSRIINYINSNPLIYGIQIGDDVRLATIEEDLDNLDFKFYYDAVQVTTAEQQEAVREFNEDRENIRRQEEETAREAERQRFANATNSFEYPEDRNYTARR
jgi:hypothetical protein